MPREIAGRSDTSSDEGPYGINDATQDVFSTLNVIADVTGGRVTKYDDDLSKGVLNAANDLRGTYTVGFYAADEPDDRWHAIGLATKRRGITLRHRQGYLSAARTQPQTLTPEGWTQLAHAPLGSSGIRFNGRPTITPQQVTVLLQIAAGDLYFQNRAGKTIADLEIGVVQKAAGRVVNLRQQPLEVTLKDPAKDQRAAVISSATTWPLVAETTAIRVIVRDRLTALRDLEIAQSVTKNEHRKTNNVTVSRVHIVQRDSIRFRYRCSLLSHSFTRSSRMFSGTAPDCSTTSLKSRRSNFSPSAFSERRRSSLIFSSPIL